jgi:hypothetical protein
LEEGCTEHCRIEHVELIDHIERPSENCAIRQSSFEEQRFPAAIPKGCACGSTKTFESTLPKRLTKIDDLTRPDHTFLELEDECFYLGEYTARRGFAFSETNNLINNPRKPMERRGRPEWRYKESAILTCGRMLREAISEEWLDAATLVPVPGSKMKGDVEYDDRMPRILQELGRGRAVDQQRSVALSV